ncbi:MAG: phosphatidate cytidylyltransferase [Bacteroidia bacterium]|nr:phosphatidate cytidylyltransferase [Bacteroidia bacterium]
MNNFIQRALTGIVFVAVVVGATMYNQYAFLALLLFISIVGVWEYFRIVTQNQLGKVHYLYIMLSAFIVMIPAIDIRLLVLLPLIFALTAMHVLLTRERTWQNIGNLFIVLFYIPLPLMMFYHSIYGSEALIFNNHQLCCRTQEAIRSSGGFKALNLFILIWSSDTFAYLAGRAFGKRKLFESVSPKKTWEGFIGGAVLTVVFSLVLSHYFDIPVKLNLIIALLTVVFGTLGDLIESMLKRQYGIKDSGNILPGHGGILDRFDALFISLPFTTILYYLDSI